MNGYKRLHLYYFKLSGKMYSIIIYEIAFTGAFVA